MFFNGGGGRRRQTVSKAEAIVETLNVSLKDLYIGFEKTLKFKKHFTCLSCDGTGSKSKKKTTCSGCSGSGMTVEVVRMGPMIQQMQSTCNQCRGTGECIDKTDICTDCKGAKTVVKTATETITIKGAVPNGAKIQIENKGNELPNGINGDLVVQINVQSSKHWKRENPTSLNLVHLLKVSLNEHYKSEYIYITHLDDSILRISKKNFAKKITTFVIPNKGLRDFRNLSKVGNVIVILDIVFPDKLINDSLVPIMDFTGKTVHDVDSITGASSIASTYFKSFDSNDDGRSESAGGSSSGRSSGFPGGFPGGIPVGFASAAGSERTECAQQ